MKKFRITPKDVIKYNNRISPSNINFIKINKDKINKKIYERANIDNIN